MDYELVKKLKDAGFPQTYRSKKPWCDFAYDAGQELHMLHEDNDTNWWLGNDYTRRDMSNEEMERDWVKVPTLEELIKVCGNDFGELGHTGPHENRGKWRASQGWDGYGGYENAVYAETPTEAVALFWLSLNEK